MASAGSESENEIGHMGFINTLKIKGQPSSSPATSAESDHYDADSDRSSVSFNTEGEKFGWFYVKSKSSSAKSSSKTNYSKPVPHYEMNSSGKWEVKSARPHPKINVKVELCQDESSP